jgi:hypothetical protein
MNIPAAIGMLIGSTMIVYMLSPLFRFLIRKICAPKSEKTEKNIAVILSSVACTTLYCIVNKELVLYHTISALIIISLRDILKNSDVNQEVQ